MATMMKVLVNGVECERKIARHTYWNGFHDLAVPVLYQGECIDWVVGSRVPEIRSW